MEEKPDQEAAAAEIKRQLEAIVGHEIDTPAEQLLEYWYPTSSFAFTPLPSSQPDSIENGGVRWTNLVWTPGQIPGKRCLTDRLLDVSGAALTESNGQRVFLLSDFVCAFNTYAFAEPINVVATPRASAPFFLTVAHKLINIPQGSTDGGDVQITVFTWKPDGAAAPGVTFDWRCRVVAHVIYF